jgi:hypothetical protein
MSYLGKLKRSEAIRLFLTLDAAATGFPTVTIEKQGVEILAAANMTAGLSSFEWYYDYTTGAAATVGAYQIRYTAVIDTITRYDFDYYDQTINEIDDVKTDTETIIATIGASAGASSIVINIKDGDTNNVEGVSVSIHNSANDDPAIQTRVTDVDGNTTTINLDDATYKVRLSKAGAIVSEVETIVVNGSATHNLTVVNQTVSNPSDPDVCRLRVFPLTLGNADVTGETITISTAGKLTKVDGQFISNTSGTFTEDATTDPDSYYFDAVRGSVVHITNTILGLDDEITVPDQATYDIGDSTDIVTRN